MKRILHRSLMVIGSIIFGAGVVVLAEMHFLNTHAPAGPAQAKGMEGHYYNWVYALTPCPSTTLQRYEDAAISFKYYFVESSPRMERHYSMYVDRRSLAETMLHYEQLPAYMAGNTYLSIYKPKNRKPAGPDELKTFVLKYAEENVGPKPEINYGDVSGAPFSAYFTSGSREGICFTDTRGGLYCFEDQNMAMQRGADPFMPTLLCSLGLGAYSLDDYASYGLKDWFVRPSHEKCAECNFMEIKRTMVVKGKNSAFSTTTLKW